MTVRIDIRPASTGSDLCTACGLCCDGTLFARMRIAPDEFPLAALAGSAISNDGGQSYARQPCGFLQGSVCSVYHDRYAVCVGYRCRLLRQVEEGAVTPALAAGRVREARRLRDAARDAAAQAGLADAPCGPRDAADWRATSDPASRRRLAIAHLAALALDLFLDRHFRKRPRRASPETDGAAAIDPVRRR